MIVSCLFVFRIWVVLIFYFLVFVVWTAGFGIGIRREFSILGVFWVVGEFDVFVLFGYLAGFCDCSFVFWCYFRVLLFFDDFGAFLGGIC